MESLSSLRVVDVTNSVAGPFAAMILGDLGADVIKVEPPRRGDVARGWGPRAHGGNGTSFLVFNRNKTSIAVDLGSEKGREILRKLVESADVLLTNSLESKRPALGLDYDTCARWNPRLIYCALNAYGSVGPMRDEPGYDALMQARSGLMSITGEPDGGPVRVPVSIVDMGAGLWAAIALLNAIIARQANGRGQKIDTSLFETAVAWSPQQIANYKATGDMPKKHGSGVEMIAPYEAFATADGFILIAANTEIFWRRLCEVITAPDLLRDKRFADNRARVHNRQALSRELGQHLGRCSAQEWERRLSAAGVPCSRVASLADMLEDEQTRALGIVRELSSPGGAGYFDIAPPFSIDGRRTAVRRMPPALGEQSREILARHGYSAEAIEELVAREVVGTASPQE